MPDEVMPHDKIGIEEMIDACRTEAYRIENSQRALVEMRLRGSPDPIQMRRRAVFDAIALMLERIDPHLDELRRIVARRRWG